MNGDDECIDRQTLGRDVRPDCIDPPLSIRDRLWDLSSVYRFMALSYLFLQDLNPRKL